MRAKSREEKNGDMISIRIVEDEVGKVENQTSNYLD